MSHHLDDDDTSFRVVTAEQATRRCKHGSVSQHGEPGKDWCPGAMSPLTEPWRRQLVDQMNMDTSMFTKFAEPLRHQRLTDDELRTVQRLHDAVTGPVTAAAYREYMDVVIFPRFRLDEGDVIHGRLHESTPIYDALVLERFHDMYEELPHVRRWRETHADLSQ